MSQAVQRGVVGVSGKGEEGRKLILILMKYTFLIHWKQSGNFSSHNAYAELSEIPKVSEIDDTIKLIAAKHGINKSAIVIAWMMRVQVEEVQVDV